MAVPGGSPARASPTRPHKLAHSSEVGLRAASCWVPEPRPVAAHYSFVQVARSPALGPALCAWQHPPLTVCSPRPGVEPRLLGALTIRTLSLGRDIPGAV